MLSETAGGTSGNGNTGLLLRAVDPGRGTDALNGYYIGIGDGGIQLGQMSHDRTSVHSSPIRAGQRSEPGYTSRVTARGRVITVTARQGGPKAASGEGLHRPGMPRRGAVGVRTFDGIASWRNLTVTPL